MNQRFTNKEQILESIKKENWEHQKSYYSQYFEQTKINLIPDNKISITKFIPSKIDAHCFYAHPSTIAAMRRDLFFGGEDLDQFSYTYKCQCGETLDLQFWKHCPFCESSFPKELRWKD